VDLARKDLGLAVDMARSHDVPVPATSLLHQLYNASSALDDAPNDFAAIVKLFESWARTEVPGLDGDFAPPFVRKGPAQIARVSFAITSSDSLGGPAESPDGLHPSERW
jgi:hypothetical protein